MVHELRRLTFADDEIRSALVDFCYRTNIAWPSANIERLEFDGDPERFLTVVFGKVHSASHRLEQPGDIVLSQEQVFAALLLFCKKHKIHLKRDARKKLFFDERGTLMLDADSLWTTLVNT